MHSILRLYFKLVNYSSAEIIDGNTYRITGTVSEKGIYSDGEYIILNGTEANNINLKGKIIVYLNKEYGDYCDIGYKVTLFGIVNYITKSMVVFVTFCLVFV